jgi:cytochrome P450 family 307 subfamily A
MSTAYWSEPEKFDPHRFLSNGKLIKPDHFIPFGVGRRSCMGYKLVQFLAFAIVGNLLKEFDIHTCNGEDYKVQIGSLAVKEDAYKFRFSLRN